MVVKNYEVLKICYKVFISQKKCAIISVIENRGRSVCMFKNYIFDLYGTLIDIRTDEDDKALWEKMVLFYGYREAEYTP